MLKIREYVKAESLEQAYELKQKRGNVILGGMMWLKQQNRQVTRVIDLGSLLSHEIEETEEEFRIGAMVTLRQLEQHPGLDAYSHGAIRKALSHIVGVQFRNGATVGGSVYGRFGFSDLLPWLLVMDSWVELYQGGRVPMAEFVENGAPKDILVAVVIKKSPLEIAYQCQRNTRTDFPVLNCAVSCGQGKVRCSVGARPGRAVLVTDEQGILTEGTGGAGGETDACGRNKQGITPESAKAFGAYVKSQVVCGSNMRAGAEYRSRLVQVLVERACLELMERTE